MLNDMSRDIYLSNCIRFLRIFVEDVVSNEVLPNEEKWIDIIRDGRKILKETKDYRDDKQRDQ